MLKKEVHNFVMQYILLNLFRKNSRKVSHLSRELRTNCEFSKIASGSFEKVAEYKFCNENFLFQKTSNHFFKNHSNSGSASVLFKSGYGSLKDARECFHSE